MIVCQLNTGIPTSGDDYDGMKESFHKWKLLRNATRCYYVPIESRSSRPSWTVKHFPRTGVESLETAANRAARHLGPRACVTQGSRNVFR